MQFEVNIPWISSFGINYHFGIDGISLLLIVLTTILTTLSILASWTNIKTGIKGYFISMLLLEVGMVGVFCALDLFLFYIFWELMLIPMYFLIGVWGGPRRVYAAIKFVLFTMFGSLLMLVALLYLYFSYYEFAGEYTFSLLKMMELPIPYHPQLWLFGAFALAFAMRKTKRLRRRLNEDYFWSKAWLIFIVLLFYFAFLFNAYLYDYHDSAICPS